MNSVDLIKAGRLGEARAQLVKEVRERPGDAGARTLLFQTLSCLGEWDKADGHLGAIAAQSAANDAASQVYRNIIKAEKERESVWTEGKRPAFFPEGPPYLEEYFDARARLAAGRREEALAILEGIAGVERARRGTINGTSFVGFQDADPLLFPFLEVFVHDRYVWIPFGAVETLTVPPPSGFLDLLWVPARIAARSGARIGGHLPVLYPSSYRHADDRVKMGRLTEWVAAEGGLERGAGQHVFLAGEKEMGLLEIREMVFDTPEGGEGNGRSDRS